MKPVQLVIAIALLIMILIMMWQTFLLRHGLLGILFREFLANFLVAFVVTGSLSSKSRNLHRRADNPVDILDSPDEPIGSTTVGPPLVPSSVLSALPIVPALLRCTNRPRSTFGSPRILQGKQMAEMSWLLRQQCFFELWRMIIKD